MANKRPTQNSDLLQPCSVLFPFLYFSNLLLFYNQKLGTKNMYNRYHGYPSFHCYPLTPLQMIQMTFSDKIEISRIPAFVHLNDFNYFWAKLLIFLFYI